MQTQSPTTAAAPLFQLGRCVATVGADDLLRRLSLNPYDLLSRHVCGDWGDLDESDKSLNQRALLDRSRLMSSYLVGDKKVWVITDADWAVTTILLPSEY